MEQQADKPPSVQQQMAPGVISLALRRGEKGKAQVRTLYKKPRAYSVNQTRQILRKAITPQRWFLSSRIVGNPDVA